MARTGRPPKPTRQKEMQGTLRKDRRNVHEPTPKGRAERPAWLNLGARTVWQEYEPILTDLGILTDMDAETFGQWCTLAAEFRADSASMSANRFARMDAIAQRFGLDPSSRSRLSVPPTEAPTGEERFFGAG